MIGEWKSIDGDVQSFMIIKKSGRVIISSGTERGTKLTYTSSYVDPSIVYHFYNTDFKLISLQLKGRKNKIVDKIGIGFNVTYDTLTKGVGAFNPDSDSIIYTTRFIRK